tara:strand:- start:3753 stop:4316 length:564 start_codon:yes stop_codon:yes gene_type:complete
MACNVNLSGISFSCTDLPVGGLTSVMIGEKSDLDALISVVTDKTSATYGEVTITPETENLLADGDVVELNFNNKDGFSVFNDVKTVNGDGSVSTVPTIAIEFPVMSVAKRDAMEQMAVGGAELVAFVQTAAGTHHLVGFEYGLYAGTVDGTSGASRSDKNRYQLTLTGEESSLAFSLTAANWAAIVG